MAMKQEPNAPLILTISAISGLMILVLYFGVEAWFRHEEAVELDTQWKNSPNWELQELRESQRAHLGDIDAAMKKVVETGGKSPNS